MTVGSRTRPHAIVALLALFLTAWEISEAAGPPSRSAEHTTGDFALRFVRNRSDFDYPAANIDTTVEWIGVSWRQKLGTRVQGTLFGGSAALTQSNNPITAGRRLMGFHAGFAAHIIFVDTKRTRLFLSTDYTFQDVDDDVVGQKVSLEWHQVQLQLGASVSLGTVVCLYGGPNYGVIDGQQLASGAVNQTSDFDRGPVSGAFVGLEANVQESGFIGIELQSGLNRYAEIFFKHRF